jgi:hypothetical protein
VGDDALGVQALVLGRGVAVQEQEALAKRDQPHVLHRAGPEVRHRHQIQLLVGVGPPEPRGQRGQDLRGPRQRPRRHRAQPLGRDDPQRHARDRVRARRHDVEVADGERDQVGRQRRRRLELEAQPPVGVGGAPRLGPVGQRHHPGRHAQRRRERRLEARLVEADEGLARLQRLELRVGVCVVADRDAVQPHRHLGQRRVELEAQHRRARLQRRGERELQAAVGSPGASRPPARARPAGPTPPAASCSPRAAAPSRSARARRSRWWTCPRTPRRAGRSSAPGHSASAALTRPAARGPRAPRRRRPDRRRWRAPRSRRAAPWSRSPTPARRRLPDTETKRASSWRFLPVTERVLTRTMAPAPRACKARPTALRARPARRPGARRPPSAHHPTGRRRNRRAAAQVDPSAGRRRV